MKSNSLYKRAHNRGLTRLEAFEIGADIGSEPQWAAALGVSRTTVRAMFARFAELGLVASTERRRTLLRRPRPADPYPDVETEPVAARVESRFLKWVLHGDRRPGETINVLDLSRQFGVSASAIREFLGRLRQYGLIERLPNGNWVLQGFTDAFAEELSEVRTMFELRAALRFIALPEDAPAWAELEALKREHIQLLAEAETRFADFSELDERFHRCVNDASQNRFIVGFADVISMIFHYHYQWNKRDEKERNIAAIGEHLACIDAIERRDADAVERHCRAHMATARQTLLASLVAVDGAPGQGNAFDLRVGAKPRRAVAS
jgi:DNA-binding GntR family transcriptional regulator